MNININTDAIATDSLIEANSQRRIPSNFEFVKGDQVNIDVTLYNKEGTKPAILSRPDARIKMSVGIISTRQLFTQAQQRAEDNGTYSFVLDLARNEVMQASGNLALEVSFEASLESEVLLQAPIRLLDSYISSPLLPSYPTAVTAQVI